MGGSNEATYQGSQSLLPQNAQESPGSQVHQDIGLEHNKHFRHLLTCMYRSYSRFYFFLGCLCGTSYSQMSPVLGETSTSRTSESTGLKRRSKAPMRRLFKRTAPGNWKLTWMMTVFQTTMTSRLTRRVISPDQTRRGEREKSHVPNVAGIWTQMTVRVLSSLPSLPRKGRAPRGKTDEPAVMTTWASAKKSPWRSPISTNMPLIKLFPVTFLYWYWPKNIPNNPLYIYDMYIISNISYLI